MTHQKFIDLAKSKGFTNIQITEETNYACEIIILNDSLEDYSTVSKIVYTVKAEYNGKTEKTTSDYLDESIIELLIEKVKNTESNYKDKYLTNRKNNNINKKININVDREIALLKSLNELKKQYQYINNIENYYTESYIKTRIINSNGIDIATDSHTFKYAVEATAKKDDEVTSYSKSILTTKKEDIEFEKIINTVLKLAEQQLNKEKLETNRYNILLDSSVAAGIINNISTMLSAQNIRQKTSCLEGTLNSRQFSEKLTIIEEPLSEKYPGYTIFDKEGTNTINKTLIEKGIIKTYLYDNKEAAISNKDSSGNNYGAIGTRNMYVVKGQKKLEETIKNMKNGIYITDYMGASSTSINCSTGNISLQIFGFIIRDGKIIKSFNPCIMTTTIFELLNNIEEICSDLTFERKSIGSPSILISNISVAA